MFIVSIYGKQWKFEETPKGLREYHAFRNRLDARDPEAWRYMLITRGSGRKVS